MVNHVDMNDFIHGIHAMDREHKRPSRTMIINENKAAVLGIIGNMPWPVAEDEVADLVCSPKANRGREEEMYPEIARILEGLRNHGDVSNRRGGWTMRERGARMYARRFEALFENQIRKKIPRRYRKGYLTSPFRDKAVIRKWLD